MSRRRASLRLRASHPEPEPLRPVIWGVLHTGGVPLYVTARIEDGRMHSEATTERVWPPDEKVVSDELGLFLRTLEQP